MKIGILTSSLSDLTLDEIIDWSSDNGFGMLEVVCYPRWQETEAYGVKTHLDVDSLTPAKAKEIRDHLTRKRIEISALNYHTNTIDLDPERRRKIIDHMMKTIVAANRLGAGIVSAHIGRVFNPQVTGRNWYKDIDYNFEQVMGVWPKLVRFAAENNVKIAVENCPMIWPDTWPGGDNLLYSPAIMRRMFREIPDANFGLNYDPSHHVFQFIDYKRVIYEFSDRIFHIHAKDVYVDKEALYEDGILNARFSLGETPTAGIGHG